MTHTHTPTVEYMRLSRHVQMFSNSEQHFELLAIRHEKPAADEFLTEAGI